MIPLTTTEAFDIRVLLLNVNAAVGPSQKDMNPPPEVKVKMLVGQVLDILHTAEQRKEIA